MLQELKEEVLQANKQLTSYGLVKFTWGNVSGIDKEKGLLVIKPSGVEYERMTIDDLVVLDLNGRVVEGRLNPSSDMPTHLQLYKAFDNVGAIVHTHSTWATIWAQAGRSIPVLGTTHADYYHGAVLCTRNMSDKEIEAGYEKETGNVIIETIGEKDALEVPGILVKHHAPFCWGKDVRQAIYNAVVLEEVAKMAYHSLMLNSSLNSMNQSLLDKHYLRKHGKNAYYGQ